VQYDSKILELLAAGALYVQIAEGEFAPFNSTNAAQAISCGDHKIYGRGGQSLETTFDSVDLANVKIEDLEIEAILNHLRDFFDSQPLLGVVPAQAERLLLETADTADAVLSEVVINPQPLLKALLLEYAGDNQLKHWFHKGEDGKVRVAQEMLVRVRTAEDFKAFASAAAAYLARCESIDREYHYRAKHIKAARHTFVALCEAANEQLPQNQRVNPEALGISRSQRR
jgi:hypothetical protein